MAGKPPDPYQVLLIHISLGCEPSPSLQLRGDLNIGPVMEHTVLKFAAKAQGKREFVTRLRFPC